MTTEARMGLGHRQIVGVDGCKAGWVAAIATVGDVATPRVAVFPDIDALVAAVAPDAVIAIDMPIGLPERIVGAGRAAERLVRPLLGARQSSVFAIPARKAVEAASYADACHQAVLTSDPPRKVSKQAFFLFGKVRQLDEALRRDASLVGRVRESHPEVVFRALQGGQPLAEPKKVKGKAHGPGLALRRSLLAAAGLGALATQAAPPRGAGADDLLDAFACLMTARAMALGAAESFPDPPLRDAHGLPMAIVAPRPHKSSATTPDMPSA
jgi:predicted RNase H-like nuclease